MAELTLIRTRSCPYVQRAIIALSEKQARYDVVFVDLADKPDWFRRISPLGKVPLLKVARPDEPDAAIFESSVIVEFIEEFLPGHNLHPGDPVARAEARSWMEFGSQLLPEVYAVWMARTEADYAAAREKVSGKLAYIEDAIGEGPYFDGDRFGCVDVTFAPLFGKVDAFESLMPIRLLDDFPKLAAWSRAVALRPSVRDSTPDNQAQTLERALNLKESYLAKLAA